MKILLHDLKEIITFVAYIVYLVSFLPFGAVVS